MQWSWRRRSPAGAVSNAAVSVGDEAFAQFLGIGKSIDGVPVDEGSVLGIAAFYRALSLITGQLALLPFRSYTSDVDGLPRTVGSIFDDPDGPDGQTVYEWKETAFAHLLLHGWCGGPKVFNNGGGLVRIPLVHPGTVSVEDPTAEEIRNGTGPVGGLWFRVTLDNGRTERYDQSKFWYVPGLSIDGKRGLSLLTYARLSLATAIAGDRAAGNLFQNGGLISGLATPDDEEDVTDDVPKIQRDINNAVGGVENAGKIVVINRRLKIQPWTMTAADAQFLQSRQFQIEEISRWTGVPPHLLMQTDKQTSWGTGVEMQDRALGRTVLAPWASRFEQRASRLLARPRWAEFDFAGLERPTPEAEIALLVQQINVGLLTLNEARKVRNLPPVDGGDVPRGVGTPATQTADGTSEGGQDDPTAE
jgi:HK97 family phage portal protein